MSSWKAFIAPKADPGGSAPMTRGGSPSLLQDSASRSWNTLHCGPPLPLFQIPPAAWREEQEKKPSSLPTLLQVTSWEIHQNLWETNTNLSGAEYVFLSEYLSGSSYSVVSLPTCARSRVTHQSGPNHPNSLVFPTCWFKLHQSGSSQEKNPQQLAQQREVNTGDKSHPC